VPAAAVLGSAGELRGADMAKTIAGARARQQYRGCMNCRLSTAEAFSRLEGREEIARLLERATERFCLSARSLTAVVKAAITIADLELSDDLLPRHLQEALQYRRSPDYWI